LRELLFVAVTLFLLYVNFNMSILGMQLLKLYYNTVYFFFSYICFLKRYVHTSYFSSNSYLILRIPLNTSTPPNSSLPLYST